MSQARFGVRVYKEYFNFASAHFLLFPDGGREKLHGHNYQVRCGFEGEVNAGDMVVDFCLLKPIVRRFCNALDHRMLLPERCDRLAIADKDDHLDVRFRRPDGGEDRFLFPRRDCVLLPITNTSTERLAEHLSSQIVEAVAKEAPGSVLRRLELEVEESRGQCGVYLLDLQGPR